MTIKRETLHAMKNAARKRDYEPSTATIHTLLDASLDLLDQLEGGPQVRALRGELLERERQVKIALDDLQSQITLAYSIEERCPGKHHAVAKAKLMAELLGEMIRAKGPAWTRTWDWYTPRIEEEFECG